MGEKAIDDVIFDRIIHDAQRVEPKVNP